MEDATVLNYSKACVDEEVGWFKDDGQAAIADGNRLILVDYDNEYSYWLSKYSNSYDYPMVLNHHSELLDSNLHLILPQYGYILLLVYKRA